MSNPGSKHSLPRRNVMHLCLRLPLCSCDVHGWRVQQAVHRADTAEHAWHKQCALHDPQITRAASFLQSRARRRLPPAPPTRSMTRLHPAALAQVSSWCTFQPEIHRVPSRLQCRTLCGCWRSSMLCPCWHACLIPPSDFCRHFWRAPTEAHVSNVPQAHPPSCSRRRRLRPTRARQAALPPSRHGRRQTLRTLSLTWDSCRRPYGDEATERCPGARPSGGGAALGACAPRWPHRLCGDKSATTSRTPR